MLTFDELFQRLNEQDESVEIEAKTAQQMGNSILETICAFSNEPNRGGGYILLGVRHEPDSLFPGYEVVGISSPDIRRTFPLMRLDYIRVPGREWVRDPDSRFETIDILDPLMTALPRALNAILDDLPKAFHLPANEMRREDLPLLPRTAIREALVNAVMHRSYRHKSPVQIIRYANRLEIRNPGHSLVPDDRLGEPGSMTRNEKIAAVLHETGYAETKGSGIRSMRQAMSQASLSPPTFESDRAKDSFVVTFLFHHFLNAEDVEWLGHFSDLNLSEDEQKALVYAREIGAINNASYRDINRVDTLVVSGRLRHLRDLGLLEQKGKSVSTYYEPTAYMLTPEPALPEGTSTPEALVEPNLDIGAKPLSKTNKLEAKPISKANKLETKPISLPTKLEAQPEEMPADILELVRNLGNKARGSQLREVILRACQHQPLSIKELSALLNRTPHYLLVKMIQPMVAGKELFYTHPDNPTHPQQKYTTLEP